MWNHYLITAWRNMMKGRLYSAMNLLGLAISITAVLLMSLYILSELSADRQHSQHERIYRVSNHWLQPNPIRFALSPGPMGPALASGYPDILSYLRLMYPSQFTGNFLMTHMEKRVHEDGVLFADTNFFDFFDYDFVYGNPQQALSEPNNIVLTEEKAVLFFGDANPIGQILRINESLPMTVSAVIRPHSNPTHLRFHYLIPLYTITDIIQPGYADFTSYSNSNCYTYLMVKRDFNPGAFTEEHLEDFVRQHLVRNPDVAKPLEVMRLDFTPLRQIYFDFDTESWSELPNPDSTPHKGSKTHMLVFGLLAVFLSIIAVINYTNMAIARSTSRSKEVGVRKVLGSSPKQLFMQYIGEAGIFVFISLIVALFIAEVLIPGFNSIMDKSLSLSLLLQPENLLLLLGFFVILSLISGSYPALYMARIQPVDAIKGQFKIRGRTVDIKSILFSFQFFVSVFIIICTLLVTQQFRYMGKKDMGFASEHRLSFTLPNIDRISPEWIAAFKSGLLQHSDIQLVSLSLRNPLPGRVIETWSYTIDKDYGKEDISLRIGRIDTDFLDLFNIPVVAGRGFSSHYPTDLQNGVLLNETAVRDFGWENPVGMTVDRGKAYKVLGVVQDFHYFPLHQPIEPMMLLATNRGPEVSVLLNGNRMEGGLMAIEKVWKDFLPEYPMDYTFIDSQLAATLSEERKNASLLAVMTIFAIFISLAGLFGLSAFTAEKRTREIAIRRTYGASLLQISGVVSRGIGKLLGISLLMAVPASYLYMSRWLESFSYRIELTPWPFLTGVVSAALIAFVTLWVHAARTAACNPIDKLKHE